MSATAKSCGTCKSNLTAVRHPGISCSNCGVYYHYTCIDLGAKSIESIESDDLHWLCSKCKKVGKGRRSNIIPAQLSSPRASRSLKPVATVQTVVPIKKSVATIITKPTVKSKPIKIQENDKLAFLSAAIKDLQQKHISEIAELKIVLDQVTRRVDKLSTVEEQVVNLKSTANQLEIQTDLNERKLNTNFVEIQGLTRNDNRNIKTTIESITLQIKSSINSADIKYSYTKLAPLNSKKPDKLILEFSSFEAKQNFVAKGKAFTRSGQQFEEQNQHYTIFVNDLLTSYQKRLLFEAKQLAKINKFQFVWIFKSQVYIKKDHQSEPVIIKTFEALDTLFSQ